MVDTLLKPRVFDAFLFNGEWDNLQWRFEELGGVVDVFVLVEANRSFQGALKPLEWPIRGDRIRRPAHMGGVVEYVPITEEPPFPVFHPMRREEWQRDQIMRGLSTALPHDLVLVSDVDELPRASAVLEAQRLLPWPGRENQQRWSNTGLKALKFEQALYHGWINMRCQSEPWWPGTHATRRFWLSHGYTPQLLRVDRACPSLSDAGWHFSFLGGVAAMQKKLSQWSHYEWNTSALRSAENLSAALRDVRDWDTTRRYRYALEPVDERYPACIYEHRDEPRIAQHIKPAEVPA